MLLLQWIDPDIERKGITAPRRGSSTVNGGFDGRPTVPVRDRVGLGHRKTMIVTSDAAFWGTWRSPR